MIVYIFYLKLIIDTQTHSKQNKFFLYKEFVQLIFRLKLEISAQQGSNVTYQELLNYYHINFQNYLCSRTILISVI